MKKNLLVVFLDCSDGDVYFDMVPENYSFGKNKDGDDDFMRASFSFVLPNEQFLNMLLEGVIHAHPDADYMDYTLLNRLADAGTKLLGISNLDTVNLERVLAMKKSAYYDENGVEYIYEDEYDYYAPKKKTAAQIKAEKEALEAEEAAFAKAEAERLEAERLENIKEIAKQTLLLVSEGLS